MVIECLVYYLYIPIDILGCEIDLRPSDKINRTDDTDPVSFGTKLFARNRAG